MDQDNRTGERDEPAGQGPVTVPSDEEKNAADYIKGLRRGYVLLVWAIGLAPLYPFLQAVMIVPFVLLLILMILMLGAGIGGLRLLPKTNGAGRDCARSAVALPSLLAVSMVLCMSSLEGIRGPESINSMWLPGEVAGHGLLKYMEQHDGHLPPANEWSDILMKEGELVEYDFGYGEDRKFAINSHAYKVEGRMPDDIILLFEAGGA